MSGEDRGQDGILAPSPTESFKSIDSVLAEACPRPPNADQWPPSSQARTGPSSLPVTLKQDAESCTSSQTQKEQERLVRSLRSCAQHFSRLTPDESPGSGTMFAKECETELAINWRHLRNRLESDTSCELNAKTMKALGTLADAHRSTVDYTAEHSNADSKEQWERELPNRYPAVLLATLATTPIGAEAWVSLTGRSTAKANREIDPLNRDRDIFEREYEAAQAEQRTSLIDRLREVDNWIGVKAARLGLS